MTTIRVLERKNLGDYQHRECEITTVIEDGANEAEAINSLIRRVRWHLGKPEAEHQYNTYKKLISTDDEPPEDLLIKATNFIAKYETALAEIEG